ncbi:MAG: DUF3037 domain-containing protein [Bacteroidota bacterium]
MPAYDYALLRAVDVPAGDCVTVGVILHCRQARYLGLRLADARGAADRLGLDERLLAIALEGVRRVSEGGASGGPVGRLPASERFHFLTAVRSTALQASPVRTGTADDPAGALDEIAQTVHAG